jgi:NAD(P)-dependent dehydrogenase (short-subunit alcohol dehydrogenase family)
MKSVVITGSTRGVGWEMAREFLRAGCRVTVSGRGEKLPGDKQEALTEAASRYIYVPCDVQKEADVQALWDASALKWGQVDVWINNAGQNVPHACVFDLGEACADAVIHTNITGMISGSRVAVRGMIAQNHGAIYSMEGLGSDGRVLPKTILYGMTKRALTYFMKGLALELAGTGVIAGTLSPGMMLTDFILKDPNGKPSPVLKDEKFRKVFNILADRPDTVAAFFVPRILKNTRNGTRIAWLTGGKAAFRFLTAPFKKRRLI